MRPAPCASPSPRTRWRASGGVEAYVEQSVRGLIEAGHDVCVFTEDPRAPRRMACACRRGPRHPANRASADTAVRAYAADVVIVHGLGDPAIEEVPRGDAPVRVLCPRVSRHVHLRREGPQLSRPCAHANARSEAGACCATTRERCGGTQPGDDAAAVSAAAAPPGRRAAARLAVRHLGAHRR